MKIELKKHHFDYRRFMTVIPYDVTKLDESDAHMFGNKIAGELTEKTKMSWKVTSCVGGNCTIITQIIVKRDKRKALKGQIIEITSKMGVGNEI